MPRHRDEVFIFGRVHASSVFPIKDQNPREHTPYITWSLIGVNVAMFVWSLSDFEPILYRWGFTPALLLPSTLLTSMFLHGGILHLFGNMWYLFLFGDNVEDRVGRGLYLPFYLAAGLAASFAHYLSNPASVLPAIGASGAISGVLGAYLVFFPKVKVLVWVRFFIFPMPAWIVIGFWFALQLLFATVSLLGVASGVAFWAHVGGFLFGVSAALVHRRFHRRLERSVLGFPSSTRPPIHRWGTSPPNSPRRRLVETRSIRGSSSAKPSPLLGGTPPSARELAVAH